jgi:hypothetical protein
MLILVLFHLPKIGRANDIGSASAAVPQHDCYLFDFASPLIVMCMNL